LESDDHYFKSWGHDLLGPVKL